MLHGPFEVVDGRQHLPQHPGPFEGALAEHLAVEALAQVVEVGQGPAQLVVDDDLLLVGTAVVEHVSPP